jgi:hypothetical protein
LLSALPAALPQVSPFAGWSERTSMSLPTFLAMFQNFLFMPYRRVTPLL